MKVETFKMFKLPADCFNQVIPSGIFGICAFITPHGIII